MPQHQTDRLTLLKTISCNVAIITVISCKVFLDTFSTMLQKLSKCEDKAAHGVENLQFAATQIYCEIKNVILALLESLNLNFSKFEPFLKSQI